MAGQLLQISFRGLLNVHSRYGPRDALAPMRSLFSECFNPFVTSWTALSASGWNISCPAGIFTREAISTFQDTHNNICERILKKAILHRKNAYFFKTLRGAEVGDIFMSIIHTAELCRASPFDYLCAIMTNVERVLTCPSKWLPWNYQLALAASS